MTSPDIAESNAQAPWNAFLLIGAACCCTALGILFGHMAYVRRYSESDSPLWLYGLCVAALGAGTGLAVTAVDKGRSRHEKLVALLAAVLNGLLFAPAAFIYLIVLAVVWAY
jgi:hypothetical protein